MWGIRSGPAGCGKHSLLRGVGASRLRVLLDLPDEGSHVKRAVSKFLLTHTDAMSAPYFFPHILRLIHRFIDRN